MSRRFHAAGPVADRLPEEYLGMVDGAGKESGTPWRYPPRPLNGREQVTPAMRR